MKKLKNNRLFASIIVLIVGFVLGSFSDPCVMLLTFFGWLAWVSFMDTAKSNALVTFGSWIWGTISIFGLILVLKSGCNLWQFESNLQSMAAMSGLNYNCSAQVESLYTNSAKLQEMIGGL